MVSRGCKATWNKLRWAGKSSHIPLYFQKCLWKKGFLSVPLRVIFVGDSSHCHQGREDRLSLQTPCGHPSKPITTRSQRSCLGNRDEAEFAGSSCQANWNCNVNTGPTAGTRQSSTILGMLIPSHILGSFSVSGLHTLGNLKRGKVPIKVHFSQGKNGVSQLCLFLGYVIL